jgi:hypothetical protein
MVKLATALVAIMLTLVVIMATFSNTVRAQSCGSAVNDMCRGHATGLAAFAGAGPLSKRSSGQAARSFTSA